MEYVKYGNAGIVVSKYCWGAMNFYDRDGDEAGIQMVHEALDAGINFFDTADAYGEGHSEEVLGKALKDKRNHVVLATKLWVKMYKDDPNGRGCGRYHIMRAVEDSLKRLGTDHIDLYQLHHPDKNAPVEETISAMDTLVKQGKVRYFGVSNHYAWQMAHMLGVAALHNWEPLVSIQCQHNMFKRTTETHTAPFCKKFNIAVIAYGPLSGGLLSGKVKRGETDTENQLSRVGRVGVGGLAGEVLAWNEEERENRVYDILEELEKIAAKYNLGVNQLAMKWTLSKDWITCPILGGSRAEHFSAMYGLFDIEIDAEDLKKIDDMTEMYKFVPYQNQAIVGGAAEQKNWW